MKIYLVYEDIEEGRNTSAFKSRDKAEKRLAEIISEYPEHLQSIEALQDDGIYLGIEECELEE